MPLARPALHAHPSVTSATLPGSVPFVQSWVSAPCRLASSLLGDSQNGDRRGRCRNPPRPFPSLRRTAHQQNARQVVPPAPASRGSPRDGPSSRGWTAAPVRGCPHPTVTAAPAQRRKGAHAVPASSSLTRQASAPCRGGSRSRWHQRRATPAAHTPEGSHRRLPRRARGRPQGTRRSRPGVRRCQRWGRMRRGPRPHWGGRCSTGEPVWAPLTPRFLPGGSVTPSATPPPTPPPVAARRRGVGGCAPHLGVQRQGPAARGANRCLGRRGHSPGAAARPLPRRRSPHRPHPLAQTPLPAPSRPPTPLAVPPPSAHAPPAQRPQPARCSQASVPSPNAFVAAAAHVSYSCGLNR